jgi:glycosyltransferase involved in cell wall biosynthesis
VECILASGRVWDASKNFALLDAAAPAIRWPVRLAGECAAPDGATALVLRNVRCLGHLGRRAVAEEYAAAPIYVSPSLHEPFGLGVLEAADAGAALVLSDIPTFRELWTGAALFFAPRDAAGLAGAVSRLIGGPELRRQVAAAARRRAARYTIARTARGMLAAYGDAGVMAGAAA